MNINKINIQESAKLQKIQFQKKKRKKLKRNKN
jgi:hypothetical protein